MYADPDDPAVNWDDTELARWCAAAGLTVLHREVWRRPVEMALGRGLIRRWFGTDDEQPGKLAARLGGGADAVRAHLERVAGGSTLRRNTAVALVVAEPDGG